MEHRSSKCLHVACISQINLPEAQMTFTCTCFRIPSQNMHEWSAPLCLLLCEKVLCLINPTLPTCLRNTIHFLLVEINPWPISIIFMYSHSCQACISRVAAVTLVMDGALGGSTEMQLHTTEVSLPISLLWRCIISQLEATKARHKNPGTQKSIQRKRTGRWAVQWQDSRVTSS